MMYVTNLLSKLVACLSFIVHIKSFWNFLPSNNVWAVRLFVFAKQISSNFAY